MKNTKHLFKVVNVAAFSPVVGKHKDQGKASLNGGPRGRVEPHAASSGLVASPNPTIRKGLWERTTLG